ncbi:hypothetical protein MKQ68_08815 [Chitinophaga horti]|uniref:HEAT repeat domain-containing protein n=1 Tax=Chitinophaga horti TaxID=2920382 RepID=A0ABY6J689_9BACT|nr:hypothetical protein [Chitinophaga horti]UYQ95195.1 hypothetical protein MKQ68_08815 [Chitinophaga horti]
MDLRNAILEEHSKEQTLKLAAYIGNDKKRFAELVSLVLHDEYRVVQRAAWTLRHVVEDHPTLIKPHIDALITRLGDPGIPVAVKRNVMAVLQQVPIPEHLHGPVMNYCFDFLQDPQETIAVKSFSMVILAQLAKSYPDIRNEIVLVISDLLEQEPSAGIRSRAAKTLRQLGT